jgi:hypothetical protein
MDKKLLDSFLELKCARCLENELKLEIKEGIPYCKICGAWDHNRLEFWLKAGIRKKRLTEIQEYLKRIPQ